jgi:hypothetical protein
VAKRKSPTDSVIDAVMGAHVLPPHPLREIGADGRIFCSCGHGFRVVNTDAIGELTSAYAIHLGQALMDSLGMGLRTVKFESVRSLAPTGENASG